jgi:hypothetical protein
LELTSHIFIILFAHELCSFQLFSRETWVFPLSIKQLKLKSTDSKTHQPRFQSQFPIISELCNLGRRLNLSVPQFSGWSGLYIDKGTSSQMNGWYCRRIGRASHFILLLCWVDVHCGIYKGSYNISNISYLNSPPSLLFSFIPSFP